MGRIESFRSSSMADQPRQIEAFLKEIDLELVCKLCSKTLVLPVAATCGHVFCKKCIKTHTGSNAPCPECKQPLDGSTVPCEELEAVLAFLANVAEARRQINCCIDPLPVSGKSTGQHVSVATGPKRKPEKPAAVKSSKYRALPTRTSKTKPSPKQDSGNSMDAGDCAMSLPRINSLRRSSLVEAKKAEMRTEEPNLSKSPSDLLLPKPKICTAKPPRMSSVHATKVEDCASAVIRRNTLKRRSFFPDFEDDFVAEKPKTVPETLQKTAIAAEKLAEAKAEIKTPESLKKTPFAAGKPTTTAPESLQKNQLGAENLRNVKAEKTTIESLKKTSFAAGKPTTTAPESLQTTQLGAENLRDAKAEGTTIESLQKTPTRRSARRKLCEEDTTGEAKKQRSQEAEKSPSKPFVETWLNNAKNNFTRCTITQGDAASQGSNTSFDMPTVSQLNRQTAKPKKTSLKSPAPRKQLSGGSNIVEQEALLVSSSFDVSAAEKIVISKLEEECIASLEEVVVGDKENLRRSHNRSQQLKKLPIQKTSKKPPIQTTGKEPKECYMQILDSLKVEINRAAEMGEKYDSADIDSSSIRVLEQSRAILRQLNDAVEQKSLRTSLLKAREDSATQTDGPETADAEVQTDMQKKEEPLTEGKKKYKRIRSTSYGSSSSEEETVLKQNPAKQQSLQSPKQFEDEESENVKEFIAKVIAENVDYTEENTHCTNKIQNTEHTDRTLITHTSTNWTQRDENIDGQISQDIFNDGIILNTPHKSTSSRSARSEKSPQPDLNFVLDILPPIEFQDDASEKNADSGKANETLKPPSTSDSLPLSEVNSAIFGMGSQNCKKWVESTPIIALDDNEPNRTTPNRSTNPLSLLQRDKFSPLTVVKTKMARLRHPMTQRTMLSYANAANNSSSSSSSMKMPFVDSIENITPLKTRPRRTVPSITSSRLSREQTVALVSVCGKLGLDFSKDYGANVTTHLVVNADANNRIKDHTAKYLSALAAGVWVLSFSWVEACQRKGCKVEEGPYEVLDVSGAAGPKIARTTRLKNPLFKNYRVFCAPPFYSTTREDVEAVITNLGGTVVSTPEQFKQKSSEVSLIITEAKISQEFDQFQVWMQEYDVATVDIEWLSRTVGQYHHQSLRPFLLCSEEGLENCLYPASLTVYVPETQSEVES